MPMQIRHICPVVLLALAPALGGCWSYRASPHEVVVGQIPGPVVAEWPTRDVQPLQPLLESTPAEISRWMVRSDIDPAKLTADEKRILESSKETVLYKGIHGKSLLRIFSWKPVPRISQSTNPMDKFSELIGPGFPANARTISSRTLSSAEDNAALEKKLRVKEPKPPELVVNPPKKPVEYKPNSLNQYLPNILPSGIEDRSFLDAGKPIRIPPPKKVGEYKGLILHFQAIAYNEYEPRVLEEFERRGWAVIDISTESSTQPPLSDAEIEQYKVAIGKAYAILEEIYADQARAFTLSKAPAADSPDVGKWIAKFTDYSRKHPLYPEYLQAYRTASKLRLGTFQACPGADLDEVAKQVAIRADQAISGNCYAAETCLDYALTQRPDLQGIPIVMIGFSAGALTTPTAAAYLRDHLDAVVTIGGAANIFLVTQQSSFTDAGVRVRCGTEKVPTSTINKIGELYLKYSKLDPYNTAPMIAHLPVLQVHASMDTWVPAHLGEILYERLGKPDRLTIGAGHELLFYFLPNKAKFIADWVEEHVPPRGTNASVHR